MCYEFRNWSWKGRAKAVGNERPVDSPKREPAKTPPRKAPERTPDVARESEKTPA
jgi:hypothetical protein